jgi:phage replication O-like protein O
MADVQKENGYTALANKIVEALARVNLTAYEWRVLCVILRKTYGWQKKSDAISRSQFVAMTGIDERNLDRTIKQLEQKHIITVERHTTKTAVYSFQKDHERWQLASNETQVKKSQLVSYQSAACVLSDTKTCVSTDTHKRKKEIYKRNIVQRLHDKDALSSCLFEKFPSLNALIPEFINRVRMSNKLKAISETRAAKIAAALLEVAGKHGAENMTAGIQAAFKKHESGGFNYSGHDPVAYVRAVAKSEQGKTRQQQAEAAHKAQKDVLRAAPASGLFAEIQQAINF